nr:unnamed protein product [Naegleria fowleri]
MRSNRGGRGSSSRSSNPQQSSSSNTSQNGGSNNDWKYVQYKRGAYSNHHQGRPNNGRKTITIKTERKSTSFSIRCEKLNFGVWNKNPLSCGNCSDLEFIAYDQKLQRKPIRLEINTFYQCLQIVIFTHHEKLRDNKIKQTKYVKMSFPFSGISREKSISFFHMNGRTYICVHSKLSPTLTDHSISASPLRTTPNSNVSNRSVSRICVDPYLKNEMFYRVGKAFCFLMEIDKKDQGFNIFTEKIKEYGLIAEYKETNIPVFKIVQFQKDHTFKEIREQKKKLDFSIRYYLKSLESHGIFHCCNYNQEFFNLLTNNTQQVLCALERIYYDRFSETIPRIYNCHDHLSEQISMPTRSSAGRTHLTFNLESKEVCLMRKILVTPAKVYYLLPELDTTNRVIRHFWENRDCFFRVAFLDDDFTKLFSAKFKHLSSRLQKFLERGLPLCGYDLKFLGFSSSQLRSASTWFYLQKNPKPSTKDIREYMGDFSSIKNAAKCAARIGQSFSATYPSFVVEEKEYTMIEDISAGKYIFSDGIGKISREFADKIHTIRKTTENCPSAFQIRFAGFKGVLSVDPTMTNHHLVLRKSQLKFPSLQRNLEIVQEAKRNMGYLNRQFITILSALGIHDDVFLTYQRNMLKRINALDNDPREAHALVSLSHSHLKSYICTCLKNGISTQEPFLQQLLYCFRHRAIKELETKSKIYVEKSACLVGVMDEYGVLEEDEIFVNLSGSYGNPHYGVVKGTCIVSKNPCFHPGDIRKVEAVDHPELYHLHDVIVFPQKGQRPLPSMITGSGMLDLLTSLVFDNIQDLDGDVFFVSWEPDLIFPKPNQAPMCFEKENEEEGEEEVTEDRIISFLIEYFTRDTLGIIANLHLAQSDFQEDSIFSEPCQRLCALHSIAVDSAKTGKFADIDPDLSIPAYPHFMQNATKKRYESKKILGRLYNDLKEKIKATKEIKPELNYSNVYNPNFCFDGFEVFVDRALQLYNEYAFLITSDLKKFGVESEAQLISGWNIGQVKTYGSKQRDVEESISRNVAFYFKHFRKQFDLMVAEEKNDPKAKYKIASAWYFVAYKKSDSKLFSFAWINFMELVEIFNMKKNQKVVGEQWEDSDDEDSVEYADDVLDMFCDDDFTSDITDCTSDVGDFSQQSQSTDTSECSPTTCWGDPIDPTEFYK